MLNGRTEERNQRRNDKILVQNEKNNVWYNICKAVKRGLYVLIKIIIIFLLPTIIPVLTVR